MNPQLIVALVIAVAGFGSGFGSAWQIQDWRMGAKEKDYVEQKLAAERLSAAETIRLTQAVNDAQDAAKLRATALRRDADGVRTALVGLSHATDTALRDAATSQAACLDTSTKLKVVFLECSGKYEAVARDADLWENNAITLRDAWPTSKE